MIGIDVVDIERLRTALDRTPELEARLFTEAEISYCHGKPDPARHLAGTLAAKEAVIKTLRLGPLVAWSRTIEIVREDGVPHACIGDTTIDVSITHDGGVAAAVAVVP